MPKALLLFSSQRQDYANTMAQWLKQLHGYETQSHELDLPSQGNVSDWVWHRFEELAAWIERACGEPCALRDLLVVAEFHDPFCCDWRDFNPLAQAGSPVLSVLSLLILAFPEVHWCYHSPLGPAGIDGFDAVHRFFAGSDDCRNLFGARFVPLFDPGGMRQVVRASVARATDDAGRPLAPHVPLRAQVAVAVDEERPYAYLNAYLAYRFGFRAWVVSSLSVMKIAVGSRRKVSLALEDLFLSFPDRPVAAHLSQLEERDRQYPGLAAAARRVVVTVGPLADAEGQVRDRANRAYLRSRGKPFKFLVKPVSGVFDCWRQAGMWDAAGRRPRLGRGFRWPPGRSDAPTSVSTGHSTPGRLLAVAEVLLARARRLLTQSCTVPDAVHAASLALDAKELLGGRTPTTALEAMALQHEAEVTAESLFLGVEYNINVKDRFREIHREVDAVSRWFAASQRSRSSLNARLAIIERLAKRFRDLNQIEEEMSCLSEARKLRFDFWVRERPYRWALWPVLRYVAFALSSLWRFGAAVGASIVVFGLWYAFRLGESIWSSVAASAYFFATLQPPDTWGERLFNSAGWHATLALQGFVAFLNLGLLISHLYLTVSRR